MSSTTDTTLLGVGNDIPKPQKQAMILPGYSITLALLLPSNLQNLQILLTEGSSITLVLRVDSDSPFCHSVVCWQPDFMGHLDKVR